MAFRVEAWGKSHVLLTTSNGRIISGKRFPNAQSVYILSLCQVQFALIGYVGRFFIAFNLPLNPNRRISVTLERETARCNQTIGTSNQIPT